MQVSTGTQLKERKVKYTLGNTAADIDSIAQKLLERSRHYV